MLCEILVGYEPVIKNYCNANGLSYDKLVGSVCSYNKTYAFILDSETGKDRAHLGLLDDIPMEVALEIYLENGKLRFEQTDITHKYLGLEKESVAVPRPSAKPIRPSVPNRPKPAYA